MKFSRSLRVKLTVLYLLTNIIPNGIIAFVMPSSHLSIFLTISVFCLTFLIFFIFSRWIMNPFQEMISVMKKVQEGDLQIRMSTEGGDEMAFLGKAFNTMIGQLNNPIVHECRASLSQRNAEYYALQAQIQPHFLYNILNCFVALNRSGEQQALEKAILALSALFRYIQNKEEWVALKDEFLFLQRYCSLQQLRFQDKMTFVIRYDDALANFKLPKVLLQPLVENAIVCRMELAGYPCQLHVLATLKQEDEVPIVRISIQDNGIGLDAKTQQDWTGPGLSNTEERLKLAYENASLEITSLIGGGTQIVIEVPMSEEEHWMGLQGDYKGTSLRIPE